MNIEDNSQPSGEKFSAADAIAKQSELLADDVNAVLRERVLRKGVAISEGIHANVPNRAVFKAEYGITDKEMAVIDSYRGAHARAFNDFLRGQTRHPQDREGLAILQELFSKHGKLPATAGGEVLFRGLPLPPSDGNAELIEPGFMSSTISKEVGIGFAASAKKRDGSGYLVRMVMPEGIKYLPVGAGEKEVILQPGLKVDLQAPILKGTPEYQQVVSELSQHYQTVDIDGIIDAVVTAKEPEGFDE